MNDKEFMILAKSCQLTKQLKIDDKEFMCFAQTGQLTKQFERYAPEEVGAKLQKWGVNINFQDEHGCTALAVAAALNHSDAVKLLCKAGADVNMANKATGCTPIATAAFLGHKESVEALLENGGVKEKESSLLMPLILHRRPEILRLVRQEELKGHITITEKDPSIFCHTIYAEEGDAFLKALLEKVESGPDVGLNAVGAELSTISIHALHALHAAVMAGSLKKVEILMEAGEKSEVKDCYGNTALMFAVLKGDKELVSELLNDETVNIQNDFGATALDFARDETLRALLIDKGAVEGRCITERVEAVRSYEEGDKEGSRIPMAVISGGMDVISELVEEGADTNADTAFSPTVLQDAARGGMSEVVKLLIEKGVDCSVRDGDGRSPLMLAVVSGSIDTVKVLLEKGKDAVGLDAVDKAGQTALYVAAISGRTEMVKCLLGAGANVKENNLTEPLISIALRGDVELMNLLVEHGADLNQAPSAPGMTVLHAAVHGKSLDMVSYLLKNRADVNREDSYGNTPQTLALLVKGPDLKAKLDLMKEFLEARGLQSDIKNNEVESVMSLVECEWNSKPLKAHKKTGSGGIFGCFKGFWGKLCGFFSGFFRKKKEVESLA